jgi:hypothetical protein
MWLYRVRVKLVRHTWCNICCRALQLKKWVTANMKVCLTSSSGSALDVKKNRAGGICRVFNFESRYEAGDVQYRCLERRYICVSERHLKWLEYGVEKCRCCDVEKSSFPRVAGLSVSYRLSTTVQQVHFTSDGGIEETVHG